MAGLFENLDNICRYVSEKTDDLAQKISEEMAVQKIQSQIREEDREISCIFQKIGELVYEEMKAESVADVRRKLIVSVPFIVLSNLSFPGSYMQFINVQWFTFPVISGSHPCIILKLIIIKISDHGLMIRS